MTQVHFIPAPGLAGAGGQGAPVPQGLEGLFAQLMAASQNTSAALTASDAANIAQSLPAEITRTLPSDPVALKDLLNRVKQALDKGNPQAAAALLPGVEAPASALSAASDTQQNLPTVQHESATSLVHRAAKTAVTPEASAVPMVRSKLITFQPREAATLLQHENLVLQTLGYNHIDLTQGIDLAELTKAYLDAGLTPEEAAVRVDIISNLAQHMATVPNQPFTMPVPTNINAAAPAIEPLPPRKQDFLTALQTAAQTVAPASEAVVTQILSLESIEGVDDSGKPITKTVNVPIVQNLPLANPQPVTPENEAKAATQALADLALPAKQVGMQTRTATPVLEATARTAEGQIVDSALNDRPAAHLLASVERSEVTNGVATHSGAAVSVAAYSEGKGSFMDDGRRAPTEVEDITRTDADTAALTFDRVLGQKLETQLPVASTYNAHGKIPTAADQVNISIRQLADAGGGEVRIKLMPEELGRVDIRLEIQNGQVRGVVMVERPEVLQDLARDLKHLQQALAATGLTVADNALSFQMQNQGGDQGQSRDNHAPLGGVAEVAAGDDFTPGAPTGAWRDVTKLVDVNV